LSGDDLDRRNFFRHGFRTLVRTVADSVDALNDSKTATRQALLPAPAPPPRRIRPPGALAEADFLAACTRCEACVDACPVDAIVHVAAGEFDEGTPHLELRQAACAVCTDIACSKACPDGALLPVPAATGIAMGKAILQPDSCYAFQGQFCDACVSVCPTQPAALILQDGLPDVLSRFCIGCGLCEQVCPTEPASIRVEAPERTMALAELREAQLEKQSKSTDAVAMSEPTPSPEEKRRNTRRVEPIREIPESEQTPSSIPRPLAAGLLIFAPLFAIAGVLGWIRLISTAPVAPAPELSLSALLFDFFLCVLFIAPHSIFSRGLGRRWLNIPLGPCGERPLYVFLAGCCLLTLDAFWVSSGPVLWAFDGVLFWVVRTIQIAGLVLAAWAALVVGGAHLLGLPHLRALARGRKEPSTEFVALPPYSFIRQPLNLGFLIALVAMPQVTLDRLLLAFCFGAWILFIAPVEERDAEMEFGEGYSVYRERTPRWFPRRPS